MTAQKLKIWLDFARFLLGTVALGLVATLVNNAIQTREVELKEQEQVGQFLEHALQEDVGVRRRFARYFATVTRSPELRRGWVSYSEQVEVEFQTKLQEKARLEAAVAQAGDGIERERLDLKLARVEQALSPVPAASALAAIAPRVYLHIRDEDQRAAALALAEALSGNGFVVPGVERLDTGPRRTELRYFRPGEKDEAEAIGALMRAAGVPVLVRFVGGYELSGDIRPRHYEAWIAAGASP